MAGRIGKTMIYIETDSKDAAFYFSVEEYFTRDIPSAEPVLIIWQTGNCAMLGRNQIAEAEIDIGYANRNNIQIVRRSSGGGTIFTDPGTLLYTMILPYGKTLYSWIRSLRQVIIKNAINGR
jgi:lipoate-protein ligase A